MTDHSRALWSLVEAGRQQQQEDTNTTPTHTRHAVPPNRIKQTLEEQQTTESLLSTSRTLNEATRDALTRATAHIHAVVTTLDAATPTSTAHLQNSLLLSDAELLSVSGSLKVFTDTLTKVAAVASKQHRKTKRGGDDDLAPGGAADALSISAQAISVMHGTGLVAHLRQVVAIQEQRIAATRLQVTLAKEELALFKSELFLYGHCGVLSCSDAVTTQLAHYRPPTPAAPGASQGNAREEAQNDGLQHGRLSSPHSRSASKSPRSGFGTTFRVVDGMMQAAAQTVKAASSHADSALQVALTGSHAAARQLLNAGTSSVDGLVMMSAAGDRPHGHRGTGVSAAAASNISNELATAGVVVGIEDVKLPPPPRYTLTHEEEERLQVQSQALLQLQHEATAQDAKAVEASIRELSQLTSLMNEQVMQQTEQFTLLVRNTETAHTNVQKAAGEMKKPLKAFWNPTRQLIALLWACMVLVLSVNWVSR